MAGRPNTEAENIAEYDAAVSRLRRAAEEAKVDSLGESIENHNYSSESGDGILTGSAFDGVVRVQGLIALGDTPADAGGFCCVPGFHRHTLKWGRANRLHCIEQALLQPVNPTSVQIPKDDPMQQHIQPVPLRAGSLLIWDSRLPHCNFANKSSRHRLVQYIKMAQAADREVAQIVYRRDDLPRDLELTDIGRKLFGFEKWNTQHNASPLPPEESMEQHRARSSPARCVIQ